MFAPPALIAALVQKSPPIRRLPNGVQRTILDAGDVAGPGRYRVTGISSVLNVHDAPSLSSRVNSTVKNGALATSDGSVDNGFAFMLFDGGQSGWVSVGFMAPEATLAVAATNINQQATSIAPPGPDLSPGFYSAKVSDWLNLRSGPSTATPAIGKILPGEVVEASGENNNDFARVKTKDGTVGWAASAYLVPTSQTGNPSGDLVLSASDLLQLRTMLAAWAHASKTSDYGTVDDLAFTPAAMSRQNAAVEQFQRWNNQNRGTALRTDGVVDQATRDALVMWSQGALAGAPTTPGAPLGNDPAIQPGDPAIANTEPIDAPTGAIGGIALVAALGVGAFVLLEERKKRSAGAGV